MTKKIDLSEFDAITKGEWRIIRNTNAVGGIDIGAVDPAMPDAGYRPVVQFTAQFGDQVMQIERDVADMKAIAAVPKMIAELKRMYAREEELLDALRIIRDDLDEVTSSPINEVEKDKLLKKIRNFANDASQ